jgi:hypothetical protein
MNVTVVPDSMLSYLTAWPTGSPQPLVSALNSCDGVVVANAAIVPAGGGRGDRHLRDPPHALAAAEMAAPSKASQLKQFRDAIGQVQALPPSDVISWTKMIAQHCINCALSDQNNIHFNSPT